MSIFNLYYTLFFRDHSFDVLPTNVSTQTICLLYSMINRLSIALFLIPIALKAQTEAQEQKRTLLTEGLEATCRSDAKRSPIFTNNMFHAFVKGELSKPTENSFVCFDSNGDSVLWRSIRAEENGWFSDGLSPYSWLYLTYNAPQERILLLETSGNSTTYFNGEPRGGDIYNFGTVINPVKVVEGVNKIFAVGTRGQIRVSLREPKSQVSFTEKDMTLPHIVLGNAKEQWGGVRLINATEEFQSGLSIRCEIKGKSSTTHVPLISPLITRKVGFRIPTIHATYKANQFALLTIYDTSGNVYDELEFEIETVDEDEDRKETFISTIDGSVQYYAVSPIVSDTTLNPAVILSLHGASVEAIGQARTYAPKDWATIIAPTNRRPFGFDWEDWGRLDALEVLEIAQKRLEYDPDRVYLTGQFNGRTWNVAPWRDVPR